MKKALRVQLLKQRDALDPEFIRLSSQSIEEKLYELPAFQQARTIMLYVSMGSEVRSRGMIQICLKMRKQIAVPYLLPQFGEMSASEIHDPAKELVLGAFNTMVPQKEYFRPLDPTTVDLVVTPAIAYDVSGNRLGYGGGYYDRYFKTVGKQTLLVGINFSQQVLAGLPVNANDVPVDVIIHEREIIQTPRAHKKRPSLSR